MRFEDYFKKAKIGDIIETPLDRDGCVIKIDAGNEFRPSDKMQYEITVVEIRDAARLFENYPRPPSKLIKYGQLSVTGGTITLKGNIIDTRNQMVEQ